MLGSTNSIVKKAVRTITSLIQLEKGTDHRGTELFKTQDGRPVPDPSREELRDLPGGGGTGHSKQESGWRPTA